MDATLEILINHMLTFILFGVLAFALPIGVNILLTNAEEVTIKLLCGCYIGSWLINLALVYIIMGLLL